MIRAYGVREIVSGGGILGAEDPTPWIWGRLAGDALDLATLLPALDEDHPRRANAAMALAAIAGATALDAVCARNLATAPGTAA